MKLHNDLMSKMRDPCDVGKSEEQDVVEVIQSGKLRFDRRAAPTEEEQEAKDRGSPIKLKLKQTKR